MANTTDFDDPFILSPFPLTRIAYQKRITEMEMGRDTVLHHPCPYSIRYCCQLLAYSADFCDYRFQLW